MLFRQLLQHTSNYTIGNVLMMVAGLVSFPILTRVLSVGEYGLMSLVATALSLLVGLGKLGMQHSTLRFHSEMQAGTRQTDPEAFLSTSVLGMALLGGVATLLWAVASQWVPESWWNDPRVRPLMLLTSVLILVRVFDSALINQLRAQERSGVVMVYSVLRRYASLALLLAVLFYVAGDVWGFYGATIAGELLATLVLAVWMFRRAPPRLRAFSPPLFRAMLAFGVPMIGLELSAVVLAIGDRYIIESHFGPEAVGVYSAAYNLCDYVKAMLFVSLVAAAQPMYLRLWSQQGAGATTDFLERFMHLYTMAAMLVVGGMAAIGGELLDLLASEKYRAGAPAIPGLMAAMAIESVVLITGAGLYLQKRTRTMLLLTVTSAVVNLALNAVLVPRLGLIGASVSSLASFVLLMASGRFLGRHTLPVPVPLGAALKFGTIAAVMYFSVTQIELAHESTTMLARMLVGLIIYAALSLACDREARGGLDVVARALGRRGPAGKGNDRR